MTKDITVDGLQRTTYIKDESEGKIAVKEEVNETQKPEKNFNPQ